MPPLPDRHDGARDPLPSDPDGAASGLPDPPAPELDPYLDAAARCFARHGISRTRVPDIADELGVSRVTVYRRAGNVDAMARLLLARELHLIVDGLPEVIAEHEGPQVVVAVVESVLAQALHHPVLVKVLTDDAEIIGPLLTQALPTLIERAVAGAAPLLEAAMASGEIARRDAHALAEWLVRLTITLVLAPPQGDLRELLEQLLIPALSPEAP